MDNFALCILGYRLSCIQNHYPVSKLSVPSACVSLFLLQNVLSLSCPVMFIVQVPEYSFWKLILRFNGASLISSALTIDT